MKPYVSDDSDEDSDTDAVIVDFEKLAPLEPGPGEHKLQYTYCLWFKKGVVRWAQATKVEHDYSKSLHIIGRCASVEQWWSLYSHLVKPTSLKPFRELHLFKVSALSCHRPLSHQYYNIGYVFTLERHQANVGGSGQCERRSVDHQDPEKQDRQSLGDRVYGDAGGAVYGGTRDLWDSPEYKVSGGPAVRVESDGHGQGQHDPHPRHAQTHP